MEAARAPEGGGADAAAPVWLPCTPASARLARQHIQTVTDLPEHPTVALVVTELVNNAVVHGNSRPRLLVSRSGDEIRIEVTDDDPGEPVLRPLVGSPEMSGRGLALVDALAARWGVTTHPTGGKTVWAVVRV